MKIYVIGPAGSGKTTLAKQLSETFDLSHTELDDIFWDNHKNSFGIKRDDTIRDNMYEKVLNAESWIVEGAYLTWPSNGFPLADKLIFLDLNKNVLFFRIIRRFIRRKLGFDHCKNKETIEGLLKLLKWNKKQAIIMKKHFKSANYPNLIHLSNKREINNFLKEING